MDLDENIIARATTDELIDAVIQITHRVTSYTNQGNIEKADEYRAARALARAEIIRRAPR